MDMYLLCAKLKAMEKLKIFKQNKVLKNILLIRICESIKVIYEEVVDQN